MRRASVVLALLASLALLPACSGRCCPRYVACPPIAAAPVAAAPKPSATPAPAPAPATPPKPEPQKPAEPEKPVAKIDPVKKAVLAAVEEIREEVARVRGLAWKKKVPADMLSREELLANLEEMQKEELDEEEYAKDLKILRRVGMLSETDDPLAMMKRYLGAGIQGYYDPEKDNFFMIDGLSIEGQRPVIFHELTHALDDQYVDLHALTEKLKKDEDRMFAFKCTIEGCAEHARELYEEEHPDVAAAYSSSEKEQAEKQIEAIKDVPAFLLLPSQLHYRSGLAFVQRAVGDDFVGGMARLYADMPVSQEQVLHPDRYLAPTRDLPQKVTWSPDLALSGGKDCKCFDEDGMGELDLSLWLDFHLGATGGKLDIQGIVEGRLIATQARVAAAGWDGTRMAFLEKPGQPLALLVASVWDTEKDAKEAGEAMLEALRRQYRADEAWSFSEKDGALRAEWASPNGAGRGEVVGTKVFLVDGFDVGGIDAVLAEVRKTKFERDPKDTWDAANPPDAFRDAAWKNAALSIAWKPLGKDWTVTADEKDANAAWFQRAGAPRIRVSGQKGPFQAALATHLIKIRTRLPAGFDLLKSISDASVAGKTSGRLAWTETTPSGDVKHETLFVILESGTVVIDLEAPAAEWPVAQKALTRALKGFYVRED
jgi:hypothetical protein